jgi:hypothetical protein
MDNEEPVKSVEGIVIDISSGHFTILTEELDFITSEPLGNSVNIGEKVSLLRK